APKVASTTVSPRSIARSSRTSSARTGIWSVAFGCKAFGNILRPPFDFLDQRPPGGPIPDLQVVVDSGDHDLATEARVLDQRRRQHDAALLVGCGLDRGGEEIALDHAVVTAEQVEVGEPGVDEALPVRAGICVQAAVHSARDDEAVREGLAEPGRKRE